MLIATLAAALATATVALPAAAQSGDDDASVTWDRDSNRDIDLHAAWNSPTAIAGIGSTMYVSTRDSSQVRALSLEDAGAYRFGDQIHEDDIDTVAVADSHSGIWANDQYLYVVAPTPGSPADGSAAPSGTNQRTIVAFDREAGQHVPDVEIALDAPNRQPEDIWSDGQTIYVLDSHFDLIFAYDLFTGDRLHNQELTLDPLNGSPRGLWSDGAVMWVSDLSGAKLFAYSMDEDSRGERQVEHEFQTDGDNDRPRGIWSDGTTMWIVDEADRKLFAYTHPGDTEEEQAVDPGVELMIPDTWGDVFEGDSVAYSLVLRAEPDADVVIDVTHTENEDFSISPSSLTFTPQNWYTPQDITISITHDSDTFNDGIQITHTVNAESSSDEYDAVVIDTLGLTALDIDTAGITVSALALVIDEPSSTPYTVVLDSAPASNVVIEVWKMGDATVSVAPSLLTFTPTNWLEEQQVVVTASDDADRADGTATVFHRVTVDGTSSSEFVGVRIDPVAVAVNDTDDVVVTVDSLAFDEGSNSSYSVVLDAAPSNDILIGVTVSGDSDITVSPSTLTFTSLNWSTSQDVTVSALEDADSTDDEATISHTVSPASAHITVSDVAIAVTDNDETSGDDTSGDDESGDDTSGDDDSGDDAVVIAPGATVSVSRLTVDEGGSGTYTVVLNAAPTSSDVVVKVAVTGVWEVETKPASLTFTALNWSTAQTVTVTAAHDADSGHDFARLLHLVDADASSNEYDSVGIGTVSVAVTDDDINVNGFGCSGETLTDSDTSNDSTTLFGRVQSKDINLNAGCNDDQYRSKSSRGVSGDAGRNLVWVADQGRDAALAWSIGDDSFSEYKPDDSFVFPGHVSAVRGFWVDVDSGSFHIANGKRSTHFWRDDIYSKFYELNSSGEELASADYDSANEFAYGMWGNETTTMWVLDKSDSRIYAYVLETGALDPERDIGLHADNQDASGIWSDGSIMWVVDERDDMVYSYRMTDTEWGARTLTQEFNLASANDHPRGLWSDGSTMWVLDSTDHKLYAYNATGQRAGGL